MNGFEVSCMLADLANDIGINWMSWVDHDTRDEVIRFEKNDPFNDDGYLLGSPNKPNVIIHIEKDKHYTHEEVTELMLLLTNKFTSNNTQSTRPSKDEYYLGIAQAVAKRSTCIRRQYGAVIVKDDRIISTGYNGSARGEDNCCDKGACWREKNNIPHGEQYEKCQAVHAEANAIINGNPSDMIGATLYLAGYENSELIKEPEPCMMCRRLITNARIEKVINKF